MDVSSVKNVNFLKINEKYQDDLFKTIKGDSELRGLLKKITILLQYLTLFSWFFLILAVISIFFYIRKKALILFGLTSSIHMVFAPVALIAIRAQNRYVFFCFCLANLVWLASIAFAFFYYLFVVDANDESKIQFDKEIAVHVGFIFYYPIAFFTSYYCMKMFRILIERAQQPKTPSTACTP